MALESFCLGQTQKCGGVKPTNGIPTLFIILHINCLSVGFVFFIYHLQKIYAFFWQNDHLYVLLRFHKNCCFISKMDLMGPKVPNLTYLESKKKFHFS